MGGKEELGCGRIEQNSLEAKEMHLSVLMGETINGVVHATYSNWIIE